MSKMNQLSLATSTALPASLESELDHFRQAALDGMRTSFLGTLLRYQKGRWVYGEDKTELPLGTRAIALMNEFRRGWVKWENKKAAAHVVGKIAEGFAVPPRETLGDTDENNWPIGLTGQREDPWVRVLYAPLAAMDNDDVYYTYATSSDGGSQAVYKLVERYSWLGRKHPSEYPIVALASETYEHPRFGTVHKPKLDIAGWTARPQLALTEDEGAEPEKLDAFNDEIPF